MSEKKPKKIKLKISIKKARRIQEMVCRGCADTSACIDCVYCLDQYRSIKWYN